MAFRPYVPNVQTKDSNQSNYAKKKDLLELQQCLSGTQPIKYEKVQKHAAEILGAA